MGRLRGGNGNALPVVKAAADAVTVANHQAGVAKVLERWF